MATAREIVVRLRAEVADAKRQLESVGTAAEGIGKKSQQSEQQATTALGRMTRSARDNKEQWTTAGTALTAFGVASTAAIGGSAKAAIDWESAWAGVTKTVDGSQAQMQGLNEGLRQMARELPASHGEIAAVAEAAGQLGIETPNIEGFTRTMIDMGESTNLSANDAATALARFANIMGTSQSEFSNIGSAVVDLGNNFATTEAEIVEMGLRLAGAGRQAGLTEGEVLGLATALSSVGIEAQAGGTAFSRVLIEMGTAVEAQDEKLQTFATTAGMSAEEFSRAWEEDAGSAIAAFVAGLGQMEASGQSIQPILESLGMTDIRVGDALRRASGAADLFTGAMDTGNAAYAENVALSEEAANRYETTASQLSMLKNSVVDAGISLGSVFLPAITGAAGGAADLAGWIADLPEPLQAIAGGAGAAAGAVGLLGGGFLLLAPRAIETYDAFKSLGVVSPRLNTALGAMGRTVAAGGVLVVGLGTIGAVLGAIQRATQESIPGVEGMTSALLDMADAGSIASINAMLADLQIEVNGLSGMAEGPITDFRGAIDRLLDPTFIQKAESLDKAISFGQVQTSGDRVSELVGSIDAAIAGLVQSGNTEVAARQVEMLWSAVEGGDYSREEFLSLFPQYEAALAGIDNQARLAAESTDLLASETDEGASSAEDAADAYDNYVSALRDLGSVLLGARGSAREFYGAIDEATGALGEEGFKRTLDVTTQAGRDNQQVLDDLVGSTIGYAAATFEATNSVGAASQVIGEGRQAFIETATAMGMSRDEAVQLAESLGLIPENVELAFEQAGIADIESDINGVIDHANTSEGIIQLGLDPRPAESEHEAFLYRADTSTGTPSLDADPQQGNDKLTALLYRANTSTGTPDIDADDRPGRGVWRDFKNAVDTSTGTMDIDARTRDAQDRLDDWFYKNSNRSLPVTISAAISAANTSLQIGMAGRADGGLDEAGRPVAREPMMGGPAYGRTNILWGEPETGWEAYISGKPGMEERNRSVLMEAAGRLGMSVLDHTQRFANGGMIQAEDGSWVPWDFYSKSSPSRAGMVQAEDGSWVPLSYYSGNQSSGSGTQSRDGMVQAEDGSWVPRSFYSGAAKPGGSLSTSMNLSTSQSMLDTMGDFLWNATRVWGEENLRVLRATGGWRDLWDMVQPWGVALTSAYRPGDQTDTGYRSGHADGKAIDTSLDYGLWQWLWGQRDAFRELYGPWGLWMMGQNRWNFPGAETVARTHRDHIHVRAYEDGGIDGYGSAVPRTPQIASGGRNILWAEPETGWEAYISGKPGQKDRNLAVWAEAGRRLGALTAHADGALADYANTRYVAPAPTVHVNVPQSEGASGVQQSVVVHALPGDDVERFATKITHELTAMSRDSLYARRGRG